MKKMTVFAVGLLITATTLASCGANKQVAQATPQQQTQPQTDPNQDLKDYYERLKIQEQIRELERLREIAEIQHQMKVAAMMNSISTYSVPCKEKSFDDKDYFREFGIGNVENQNDQLARERAEEGAKALIKLRLAEYVIGVKDYFLEAYSNNQSDKDASGNRVLDKMNSLVESMLNNADKICEEAGIDPNGTKRWYYTIQIPKEDFNRKLMNIMSEEDKWRRDIDAERMQNFMDERMDQMREAKKNAGY